MKKWIAWLVTLMMVLGTAAASAEVKITVSGTGETLVSADTAVITLGVNARDKDVQKAQQKVNETVAAIRRALMDLKVPEEDITTDFINLYVIYDDMNDQEKVVAYHADSTLAIKATDMDQVGTLIDAAFAAGANTLNGISFSASGTEEAEAASLRAAVANARAKADVLAEASGLKITGIDQISDSGVYSYGNSAGNVYAKSMAAEADGGTVVQAAKLVVSGSVTIVFNAE